MVQNIQTAPCIGGIRVATLKGLKHVQSRSKTLGVIIRLQFRCHLLVKITQLRARTGRFQGRLRDRNAGSGGHHVNRGCIRSSCSGRRSASDCAESCPGLIEKFRGLCVRSQGHAFIIHSRNLISGTAIVF